MTVSSTRIEVNGQQDESREIYGEMFIARRYFVTELRVGKSAPLIVGEKCAAGNNRGSIKSIWKLCASNDQAINPAIGPGALSFSISIAVVQMRFAHGAVRDRAINSAGR